MEANSPTRRLLQLLLAASSWEPPTPHSGHYIGLGQQPSSPVGMI
jgi:hypothetical protein